MATRSNISIRIKDEDVNKIINNQGIDVTLEKYMTIYCHHDGYVSGVGETLFKDFTTYDNVFSLVMDGDCSCIGSPYYKWENYNTNKPKGTINKPEIMEEYLYIFENDEWYVYSTIHPKYNGKLIDFLTKNND